MKKLLFTDLDGSLLDHHSYEYDAAKPALQALESQNIPWILTTSKTATEVMQIRAELNNGYPFIVENGAGIFWPAGSVKHYLLPKEVEVQKWGEDCEYVSLSPVSLHEMVELGQKLKKNFSFIFTGFSEMSSQQVADCTGLSLENSVKAKQRNFSEPLLWQDSEANLQKFRAFVEPRGLQVIRGGRFVHLMGLSNKGKALNFLSQYYQNLWNEKVETMALGDGYNDVPLLEQSDYPVIIRSPVNAPPEVRHDRVITTEGYGPVGWNQAVLDWLK